jgi:hypothetical protein
LDALKLGLERQDSLTILMFARVFSWTEAVFAGKGEQLDIKCRAQWWLERNL